MNKYDFTALVKNPNTIGEAETEKLRELVQTYPYFSIARNLLVKSLYKTSHYEYDSALKQAALQTGNRTVLYNLVHDLPLNTDSLVFDEQVVDELAIAQKNNTVDEFLVQTETQKEESGTIDISIAQEDVKPIISSVERFVMADEEEVPPVITKPRSTEITEEEQLVKPTGKFIKFIPKKPAKEVKLPPSNSLINSKPTEEVLNEFDVSSLNSIDKWQPAQPFYVDTTEPAVEDKNLKEIQVEIENITPIQEISVAPVEALPAAEIESIVSDVTETDSHSITVKEAIVIPELVPFSLPSMAMDEIIPSAVISDFDGKTEATDNDFLSWLLKKEPVKIEEDDSFAEGFSNVFSDQTNEVLIDNIDLHEEKDEDKKETELITIDSEIKPVPEFEFIFDFGKQKHDESSVNLILEDNSHETIQKADLLASLTAYEIDIFLAPVYRSVKFDGQMFEQEFSKVFPEEKKPTVTFIADKLPIEVMAETLPKPDNQIHQNQKVGEKVEINIPKFVPFEVDNLPNEKPLAEVQQVEEVKFTQKPRREIKAVESILDKFIRENPTIARPKSEFYNPVNMAKQSVESDEELVSETLASIYLRQGLHKKAISMYEKLGLLYPDKLAYFAGLIEKIKIENNLN